MLLDLTSASNVTQTLGGVLFEQAHDEVRQRRFLPHKLRRLEQHLSKRLLAIRPLERRRSVEHLVGQNSEGPPVDGEVVPLGAEDLRRDVLLGADEGVGSHETEFASVDRADSGGLGVFVFSVEWEWEWDPAAVFAGRRRSSGVGGNINGGREGTGEVEVGEGDVSGLLDEDVFGFEVAVGDVHGMEVLESAEDLGDIEADDGGGEDVISLAVAEGVEVAAGAVRDGPAH